MLRVACKDLGLDCNFVATGATLAEVKQKTMMHIQEIHPEIFSRMSPEQMAEIEKIMESKIK